MIGKNRYAILTVDTEALPKRASKDHVARLMWGEHEAGRAGVAEMSAIGDEFGAKHLFFVDLCGIPQGVDRPDKWHGRYRPNTEETRSAEGKSIDPGYH